MVTITKFGVKRILMNIVRINHSFPYQHYISTQTVSHRQIIFPQQIQFIFHCYIKLMIIVEYCINKPLCLTLCWTYILQYVSKLIDIIQQCVQLHSIITMTFSIIEYMPPRYCLVCHKVIIRLYYQDRIDDTEQHII